MFPNKRIDKEITGATSEKIFGITKNEKGSKNDLKKPFTPRVRIFIASTIIQVIKAKVNVTLRFPVGFGMANKPAKLDKRI